MLQNLGSYQLLNSVSMDYPSLLNANIFQTPNSELGTFCYIFQVSKAVKAELISKLFYQTFQLVSNN